MKLLLISQIDFNNPFGSHLRPYYLSHYLSKFGVDMSIICVKGRENQESIQLIERPWVNAQPIIKYGYGLFDLKSLIKIVNPDAIYAHEVSYAFMASLIKYIKFINPFNIPLVSDFHGSTRLESFYNLPDSSSKFLRVNVNTIMEKFTINNSDYIITASEMLRDFYKFTYKVPSQKIQAIPNGVDIQVYKQIDQNKKMAIRKSLNLLDKKIIFLTAPLRELNANDWNIQALKMMYKVMNKLKTEHKDVLLLIAGGGYIPKNAPQNIRYLGFVNDLNDVLNISDYAIAPYPENLKCGGPRNKVLEYFACKLPLLSTTSGMLGITESKPYVNHVPISYDYEDITNKIKKIIKMDQTDLLLIKNNAYELVRNKYNWEKSSEKLFEFFKTIL